MKIARYDGTRLGLVRDDLLYDVSGALDVLPALRWPYPIGDHLIANLPAVRAAIESQTLGAPLRLADVRLDSPVANPGKILGARGGYANDQGKHVSNGFFLKAGSSLTGPAGPIIHRQPDRAAWHEVEFAVIIGTAGSKISAAKALEHVAGYTLGLDVTMIGEDERAARKSPDSYCVLGPVLVTADEFGTPDAARLTLSLNGTLRQEANIRDLLLSVAEQIEIASYYQTLHPGDVILTGCPDGAGPIHPGDRLHASLEGVGAFEIDVVAPV